ncbi:sulfite exporter TauE/SafE family protein [Granulicoccus sp. GXG6511]|uniref:sulfite exporter TauE/SafE family protein n=1 Tax=Granulicoccus sp. GXG6511 TaxID=3381351 RepID=UPI003D7E1CE6
MSLLFVAPLATVVGLSLGALGGGGAILMVPILVYLLNQPPSAATTGSLVIVGLSSLAGIASHWKSGNVRLKDGLVFGAAGVMGSLIGSRLSVLTQPEILMTAFAVLMLVVAILMFRKSRRPAAGAGKPAAGSATSPPIADSATSPRSTGRPADRAAFTKKLAIFIVTATGVGLLTGFFGVGGGFAVVPALVLALGFSMPTAVATSLVVIVINSATALAGRAATGLEIDWVVIGVFSVLAAIGSVIGSRIGQRVAPQHLSLAFSAMMVLVACYVLAMNVPLLFA